MLLPVEISKLIPNDLVIQYKDQRIKKKGEGPGKQ
jgi:hypothetical protein